jgi:predicted MFS family arabinose efflux permease
MFLGEDLLAWLLLAFGGAMFVGNVAAMFRPRQSPREEGELTQAPKTRSVAMALLGLVASLWALFTLMVSG